MDLIIEILFNLIFEGSVEAMNRIKIPKIVRYVLIVFVAALLVLIFFALLMLSQYFMKEMLIIGIIVLAFIALIVGLFLWKFRVVIKKRR